MEKVAGRTGPLEHKKNRFESRNGGGATTRKNGKINGGQDLPVLLRNDVVERSALHQVVLGLKHDAKLRHDYGALFIGNVKFLLGLFPKQNFGFFFCNREEIAENRRVKKLVIFF